MNTSIVGTLLIVGVTLSGCGGSSSNVENASSNDQTQNSIVGLWDDTEFINGQEDIYYFEIATAPQGAAHDYVVSDIDYQGDSVDQGGNCYNIFPNVTNLVSLGGDRFQIIDPRTNSPGREVTILRIENTLVQEYVDVDDENNNGSTTDVIQSSWELVVGVDPMFVEC